MSTSRRFRLTRLKLRQYRSVAACDVALGDVTFLVGPNGSGKSNVVDALRLTGQALTENLDNALRERGGVAEVRRRSTGHPTHFSVWLGFDTGEVHGSYEFRIAAVRGGDYRVQREACIVRNAGFGGAEAHYEVQDGELVEASENVMPPATSDRLYLVAASGVPAFRPAYDGLAHLNVYSLNPEEMRRPQPPDSGDQLRRDGANIASVLERLRREDPKTKARVEEYLGTVVDGIRGVERKALGSWESLEFRQEVGGSRSPWTFPATSMSDGTLRALGVLVAIFADADGVFMPVGIEEPEIALHPAAAGMLLDALRDAAEQRQVLVTSHSPDLLDSHDLSVDDILAVRSHAGQTRVGRVDAAGRRALQESLYTPGELLRTDQLQPEERASAQLDLLS